MNWLTTIISFIASLVNRHDRQALPQVQTIDDVQDVLNQVQYRAEWFDHLSDPETTWGQKRGDCEDFAALTVKLLAQIGVNGQVLKVFCHDTKQSHAVCVFKHDVLTGGKYWFWSVRNLRKTEQTDIEQVVYQVRVKPWVKRWELI